MNGANIWEEEEKEEEKEEGDDGKNRRKASMKTFREPKKKVTSSDARGSSSVVIGFGNAQSADAGKDLDGDDDDVFLNSIQARRGSALAWQVLQQPLYCNMYVFCCCPLYLSLLSTYTMSTYLFIQGGCF